MGGHRNHERKPRSTTRLVRMLIGWAVAATSVVLIAPGPMPAAAAPTLSATWESQGPSPITNGQVENIERSDGAAANEVSGAIHTVVAHPSDPDILWVGAVNGGVWRTTDATAPAPTWTPLTDEMPGLSIGALELDPTVATSTVLVAGLGRFSSFGGIGGQLVGLLRTADGGATWTHLGADDLTGENISGVAARGNTIVVSSNSNTRARGGPGAGGIYRSTDGGATFTRLSGNPTVGLPSGRGAFDLVGDPSDDTRLYAATQAGIFRSDDTGATWVDVTNEVANIFDAGGGTNNIELAVHTSGGSNAVYAGVVNAGQLNGLWRSTDQGASWTQLDTPATNESGVTIGLQPRQKPGGQGSIHFSILADRTDPSVVYLGGDRQPQDPGADSIPGTNDDTWPNSIGASNFTGRLFRCDASLAAGTQCAPITHNGTSNNSSPHADSREMVWDANGDLVEVDDGGIYRQTDPATANGRWITLNGTLRVAESHSCSYDNVGDIILCGNQDTGAPEQVSTGSATWDSLSVADGGFTNVADLAGGASSTRFSSSNGLAASQRRVCDAANNCIAGAPAYNVVGTGQNIFQNDATIGLYPPVVMNDVADNRFVVTTNRVYESTDSLDNLNIIVTSLGAGVGATRAIAYGGRQSGVDNPGVLWIGDNTGQLLLRTGAAGAPAPVAGWTFGQAADIVLDPRNWAVAYVTDGSSVYETRDAGGSFVDITGTLATVAPNAQVFSLEVVPIAGTTAFALLAGTDQGVFVTQTQNLGGWAELGDNLPNAVSFDVSYDAIQDVVLVGTMGRGAWLLRDASKVIPSTDLRVEKSDSPDPVMAGEELFYTVSVINDGPGDGIGIVVVDDLPDEVAYLSDDAGCDYDVSTHQLTCTLDDLGPGQSTSFRIKTLVEPDTVVDEDDGTLNIRNTATVGSVSFDTDTSNNSDTEITFVQERADLKVSKICKPDDALLAGETGNCTIFVDNLGPSFARDVVLRDTHVSDGEFTLSNVQTDHGTCQPPNDGVIVCDLGDLAAASVSEPGRATVTFDVSANDEVDINDVADARSPTPDPDTSNNEARDHISVTAVADLSIDKTGPASAVAGTDITYTLALTNDGPSGADGVVVEDHLPSGVVVLAVTGSDGAGCNAGVPGDASRPTTCSFGDVAASDTRTMTVEVHVLPDTRGVIHNDVRATSGTFDDDMSDNLDTLATAVSGEADLSITKAASPDPVTAGEELTYTITATNGGPSTAFDVVVSDDLPDGTSFVSGVDGNGVGVCAVVQPGTATCDLGDLAPGDTVTVFLTVLVDPSLPSGTNLENTATITSPTTDPDPSDNTVVVGTPVVTSAELWLDKQAEARSGNPSPMVVYTIVVHNDPGCETDAQSTPTPTCGDGGPSDAIDVVVDDTLPLNPKKFTVQFTSPQCTYTEATHSVQCTTARVPAGESVTFVIEAQIQGSVNEIANTATITSSGTPDPVAENGTDTATLVMKGGTGKRS